jgi:hypothetical protein
MEYNEGFPAYASLQTGSKTGVSVRVSVMNLVLEI